MSRLIEMGKAAKDASVILAKLKTPEKNRALNACADALEKNMDRVLEVNKKDVEAAVANGIKALSSTGLPLRRTGSGAWLTD